jgi:membrane protein YdbS with pleckstrin-like domain
MDEYNQGMDPEMRKYFWKIVYSFSFGLVWMLTMAMSGLYFRLAIIEVSIRWYNIVFYIVFLSTLILLIRYFFKSWKHKFRDDF